MADEPRPKHREAVLAGRLWQLQVPAEALADSVQQGLSDASRCTPNDPLVLAGFTAWAKTVGSLRDRLIPAGWQIRRDQGYELTVRPDELLAIAVAAGDDATGRLGISPATRSSKGPATMRAISANNRFRTIDISETVDSFPPPRPLPTAQTWILLFFADSKNDEIRIELSLPVGMDDNGQVTAWDERLILPPILLASHNVQPDDGPEHINVPVERKPR